MAIVQRPVDINKQETASLWFLSRDARFEKEKPFLFTFPTEDGIFETNLKHEPHPDISIRDLRDGIPAYDQSGIGVIEIPTGITYEEYDDRDKVETILLPRLREALKQFLGADIVHIIEYKLRKRDPAFPTSTGKTYKLSQPALGVHVDYTQDEIDNVIGVVCDSNLEDWTKHRVQSLNLWSPTRGPLRDWPLCVCDSSSVGRDHDLMSTDVVFTDKVTENYQLHQSDKQKWYYLREQMPNEFMVFRASDTSRPEFAAVPHCSFQCSQASENEPLRESIEIRVLALHKNEVRK